MNIRALAHETADLAAESDARDLPALIENALRSTLRDPILRAALNCYIDTLREQIADKAAHPELLSELERDLNKALAMAKVVV